MSDRTVPGSPEDIELLWSTIEEALGDPDSGSLMDIYYAWWNNELD